MAQYPFRFRFSPPKALPFPALPLIRAYMPPSQDMGIIGDRMEDVERAFSNAVASGADVVITSGGVSMGDRDHVKPVLQGLGTIHFGKVTLSWQDVHGRTVFHTSRGNLPCGILHRSQEVPTIASVLCYLCKCLLRSICFASASCQSSFRWSHMRLA